MNAKICVLIPAYNEAKTIGRVLGKIRAFGFEAVVIDDGSTDETSRIAADAGAIVIRHDINKGKGASLREGIRYILPRPYEAIIAMDGDGQHNPAEIHDFLKKSKEENSSFIQGNRMCNPKSMPLVRVITNKVMSSIISGLCKQHIPDTQCGYKYIRKDALEKLKLVSSRYDIETEILLEASRAGVRIDSMPIKTIYQKEASYISPFIDTLRFMRLLIKKTFRGNDK